MATFTFAVALVNACVTRYTEIQQLSAADMARWASRNEKLFLENFQTNYPLVAELNGYNARVKNAFVGTIFKAYSDHYPLELSVEDVWVAIAQGVGIHLNQNAEKYRHLMVAHEGKKELELIVDGLRIPDSDRPPYGNKSVPAIHWPSAVRLMTGLIKKDMKTDMTTILTTPFSNTTLVEQAVFDCTLMDAVKEYYDLRFSLTCGIPQVTLRGSPDDFQQVIDRINQLRTIFTDFDWWLDSLLPHIQKLKESAEGKPDIDWWQKICHVKGGGSGPSYLAGWISAFIPYTSVGSGQYRKALRDIYEFDGSIVKGIDFSDFSESVTRTDFVLDDFGHKTKMKFIAGFLGIGQNTETGALRPCLGWASALLA